MDVGSVEELGRVTGEQSPNKTGSRFGLLATDLGICWDDGAGGMLVAFGDSYGEGWGGHGPGPRDADWRCNTLARAPLDEPLSTLELTYMIEDRPGHATQILPRDPDTAEETVIPIHCHARPDRLAVLERRRLGVAGSSRRTGHSGTGG